ncbi:hypothetical protein ACIBAG_02510 [Streptomyces sp. NPDC051243]|uniref:hypothetical protein n=1 Tax=Streptomyces sp. NPDC051243 TaxID=3365646 RepID=UPI0037A4A815
MIWLVTELYGHRGQERHAFVRACADGARPGGGIPESAAGIITRYARGAVLMGEFVQRLQQESRLTPYLYEAVRAALQDVGIPASR